MRKRKSVGLWITVFVAIVALFASGEVRAASTGAPAGENVTLDGYKVTVDRTGGFPAVADGDSVFKWNFSGTPAAKAIVNTINIKIPVEIEPSYDVLRSSLTGAVSIIPATGPGCTLSPFTVKKLTGWVLAPKGVGGLTTSIGRFEYDYYVLSIVPPRTGACAITKTTANTKVQVKFTGKSLNSDLNSFLVRASLLGEALNLLGPSMTGGGPTSSAQGIRTFESYSLGGPNSGDWDFRDCKMDVTFNPDGSPASVVTRSIEDPGSTDPTTTCYEVLPIESIRNTFVCEKNNCTPNPDGSFICRDSSPLGVNCVKTSPFNPQYECKTVPDTFNTTCIYTSIWPIYTCNSPSNPYPDSCTPNGDGSYACNILGLINSLNSGTEFCDTTYLTTDGYTECYTNATLPNSCANQSTQSPSFICSPSTLPPDCNTSTGTIACFPSDCKPKTFVERNSVEKSGDDSKYCFNTPAGTQSCKTCTRNPTTGVTTCVTTPN